MRVRAGCLLMASLTACEAEARPVAADAPVLSCSGPVLRSDSEVSLRRRFRDARRETVGGPEGMELSALVLWPKDKARRLEVIFADQGQRRIDLVRPAPGSKWWVAGVAVGDSLARVLAVNGDALRFSGFDWDYGGYVSGYGRGRIEALAGGCVVGMRLEPAADARLPLRFMGEGQHSTKERGLVVGKIRVSELSVAWRGR